MLRARAASILVMTASLNDAQWRDELGMLPRPVYGLMHKGDDHDIECAQRGPHYLHFAIDKHSRMKRATHNNGSCLYMYEGPVVAEFNDKQWHFCSKYASGRDFYIHCTGLYGIKRKRTKAAARAAMDTTAAPPQLDEQTMRELTTLLDIMFASIDAP